MAGLKVECRPEALVVVVLANADKPTNVDVADIECR